MESDLNTLSERRATVMYHANCTDGMGAAWAFHKLREDYYGDDVYYIPVNYGESPDIYAGDVYILDFSFSRETLTELCSKATHVTLLDHHKTAQETLENWEDKPENLEIVFDMTRSGAGIAWDYFSGYTLKSTPRPALINYIEAGDLWRFEPLPYAKEVSTYVKSIPRNFLEFNLAYKVLKNNIVSAVSSGVTLLNYQKGLCENIIDTSRSDIKILGYRGMAANCPALLASEVGSMLAEKSGTFGATYFYTPDGRLKFSLRSIGDFDVSGIAKEFGGGGHKNAAGFSIFGVDPRVSFKNITLGED